MLEQGLSVTELGHHVRISSVDVTAESKSWCLRPQIASLGLDVLVYPDVGMTGTSFALALQRLAPVQVRAPSPVASC